MGSCIYTSYPETVLEHQGRVCGRRKSFSVRGGGVLTQATHPCPVPAVALVLMGKKEQCLLPDPIMASSKPPCLAQLPVLPLFSHTQAPKRHRRILECHSGTEQEKGTSRGGLSLDLGTAVGWQDLNQRFPGPNRLSEGAQPGSWDSFALAIAGWWMLCSKVRVRGWGSQPPGAELVGVGILGHAARGDVMVSASLHGMGRDRGPSSTQGA